jgi:hypothetical protein
MSTEALNERHYPKIAPLCLAIHLTYQCPLTCEHCCFSSDMYKKGALSLPAVINVIEQGARLPTLEAVGFTGGDPFLHFDTLREAIACANAKGLKTRIVTSAYWAVNPEKSVEKLRPLVDAGLQELCISYDDSHVKFVKESNLINAYRAAEYFQIKTTVYMSTDVGDRIDGHYVRRQFGVSEGSPNPRLLILESQVTSTGRANTTASLEKRQLRTQRSTTHLGPCPSMLRQPSVTPSGKILPCCGTIPFREGMCIGDIKVDTIDSAMKTAYQDDLYKWIAFEGPVAVLSQITKDTDAPLSEADFDGICQACDVLFSSDHYQAIARQALARKADSLRLREAIFSAAGLYSSPADER